MKEYQTCLENKQIVSNNLLTNASRIHIECTFGRLKARWRVITKTADLKFEIGSAAVYSCFVLHNFCDSKNYPRLDGEELKAQIMNHRLEE